MLRCVLSAAVRGAPGTPWRLASQRAFAQGGRAAVVAKWKALFKEADTDGSGFLERKEVKKLLAAQADHQVSEDEVEAALSKADKNMDGKVDLDEFVTLLSAAKEL
eukprot:TRINITY_DN113143_c0_g1_i1.p2 TRINITY_DN113143_c0_g1~~TRINITY_DN113143_c0_g1_i1.p2  ORF type:complete len:106 (+),score=39.65 TRINITY_DN113143_c0_g1_i1:65-382(+)